MEAQLFFIPTPIGNLEDISLRSLRLLRECDAIACEDTRHTRRLLDHYEIKKPLISYHAHNERSRALELIEMVKEGTKLAVVSDAGMPGISDPGQALIQLAQEEDIPYTVLPGPSAAITAYVASGMGDGRFSFLGFIPRKGQERISFLEDLDTNPLTAICYEAPHRIRKTMKELSERWPDRQFATARELTKVYEEIIVKKGSDWTAEDITEKGEFVIVIGPAQIEDDQWTEERIKERFAELNRQGVSSKEALQVLIEESRWRKNDLYPLQIAVRQDKIG